MDRGVTGAGLLGAPAPLIPDLLRLHGRWRSGKPAAGCGGRTLSWGEFDSGTERVANALRALGVGRGDAVGPSPGQPAAV